MLTLNMAGDNWVRQGGYSDQLKDTVDVYRGIRDITEYDVVQGDQLWGVHKQIVA